MSSPLGRYRGGGWGDGGRRGGGGGIFKVGGAGGFFSPVVDVPVIISDKLLLSMSYENVEVPQIHFFDSGWTFLLCYRDVFPQCKLCRRPARSHRWCTVETPVVVQRQVVGS